MKILFFGTSSAVPSAGNGYTSFLVSGGGLKVLVDTGDNPVRSLREAAEDPFELDAVVLTHHHVDHLGSYPSLLSALDCMNRKKQLLVIAKGVTAEKARKVLEAFDIDQDKLTFPVVPAETLTRGDFSVTLLPGRHAVPTHMVAIREGESGLLYTADYEQGRGDIKKVAVGFTSLVHEATYPHEALPDPTGHSSALQAGQAAEASEVKQLFLCHFYGDAYPEGLEAASEAGLAFTGEIVEPKLLSWYTVA